MSAVLSSLFDAEAELMLLRAQWVGHDFTVNHAFHSRVYHCIDVMKDGGVIFIEDNTPQPRQNRCHPITRCVLHE